MFLLLFHFGSVRFCIIFFILFVVLNAVLFVVSFPDFSFYYCKTCFTIVSIIIRDKGIMMTPIYLAAKQHGPLP